MQLSVIFLRLLLTILEKGGKMIKKHFSKGGVRMLKRFSVENFKGFRNSLVFDLSAREYEFNQDLVKNGIVNKAIIYGRNGIGKSCLGIALFDVIAHLTDKKRMRDEYLSPYRNLDSDTAEAKFSYLFSFGEDEIFYEYGKTSINELVWERLIVNGKVLIDYDYFHPAPKFVDKSISENLNVELEDNKLSVIKYIYRNTPSNPDSPITKMIQFCENMLWYRCLYTGNEYAGFTSTKKSLTDVIYEKKALNDFQSFLRENGLEYELGYELENGEPVLYVYYHNRKNKARFFSVASTGTYALLLFYTWSIMSFENVSFLFIDEFDAFFHYQSAESIVKRLNMATGFQTVLTTHNTYLMQNRLTRPDCCFLMSAGKIANLCSATDKEIREAHNLEKMYINGAFTE